MIIFVGAYAHDYALGYQGVMPWPLMQHDKEHLHELTRGKHIVMGERTYHNYKDVCAAFQTNQVTVLSRSVQKLPDAQVIHSIDSLLTLSQTEDLWVIGGGMIFAQLLPYVQTMYLTEIDGQFEADTFFPEYNKTDWKVKKKEDFPADTENPYPYSFITLERL